MRETAANVSEQQSGMLGVAEPREELVKQLVRRQMNHSGNILLMGMEPLTDDEFFSGGPNGISPAWTVGHLACVLDLFTSWVVRCKLALPREVYAVFNPIWIAKREGTKAEGVDRKVFPKAEIMLLYRRAQVRALDALTDFDVGLWEVRPPDDVPDVLPTYGSIWQTLGAHTYWHLGELTGCISKFHGTYTLNSAINYFYDVDPWQDG
jgi:hypothetical protein